MCFSFADSHFILKERGAGRRPGIHYMYFENATAACTGTYVHMYMYVLLMFSTDAFFALLICNVYILYITVCSHLIYRVILREKIPPLRYVS